MKKPDSFIAVILTAILVLASPATSFGGTFTTKSSMDFNFKMPSGEQKASPDSMFDSSSSNNMEDSDSTELPEDKSLGEQITIEVDGTETDHISFYLDRNSTTNEVVLPEPIIVTVRQNSGSAIGNISVELSPVINADRERIRVQAHGNTNLSPDTPVSFSVSFVDKNIGDKTDLPNGSNSKFYLQIKSGNNIFKKVSIFYGADGFYTRYSAEYPQYYSGPVINGKYVNIGEVNLKQSVIPVFSIEHYYKPLTGTEDAAIAEIQINPDGWFTFADGSTVMPMNISDEGWVTIPIKMKQESFMELRNEAISDGHVIDKYNVFTDLVIAYDDGFNGELGYLAGGNMNPLPLVYHITYQSSSSHGSGGSGGSGGSSGSGGSGGSGSSGGSSSSGSASGPAGSATVVGPAQTARTTIATVNDSGWILINGFRYYMNAENQPVTDWLQWTDEKWYYLGQDGIMRTGWTLVDGKWYLLNPDGSMATGLILVNQEWHLLQQDGSMATGWAQDSAGNWRYFLDNGVMAVNYTTPDGKFVDADGVLKE